MTPFQNSHILRPDELGTYLGDVRQVIFKRPTDASRYFNINHGYISRYESGTLRAPLGYVASLVRLYDERLEQAGQIAGGRREELLKQVQALILEFYHEEHAFLDWEELVTAADSYMESRWGDNWSLKVARQLGKAPLDNLPHRNDGYIGYEQELANVLTWLTADTSLVFVEGLDGVGKTWFAIELGHQCLVRPEILFEAVIWTSAQDHPEQKKWLEDILDSVARTLRFPFRQPVPLSDKQKTVKRLLHRHRALLIIDNFNTVDDPELESWIRDVAEHTRSKVLVTSRFTHMNLSSERTQSLRLQGMTTPRALAFIRDCAQSMKLDLAGASNEELMPLVVASAGHPQVIRSALGYYVYVGNFEQAVAYALQREKMWEWRWEILTEDARALLMVMPFFAESASGDALGATAHVVAGDLYAALEQLIRIQLLDVEKDGLTIRYSMHPMAREFATHKLSDEGALEAKARLRWVEYFIAYAKQYLVRDASRTRYWSSLYWSSYGKQGLTPIDREWSNLRAVFRWLGEQQDEGVDRNHQDRLLVELVLLLIHYMDKRAYFRERITYATHAVAAAHRLGYSEDEAWLRIDGLGWTLIEDGRFDEAESEIIQGKQIAEQQLQPNDADRQMVENMIGLAHTFLARLHLKQGELKQAEHDLGALPPGRYWPVIQARVHAIEGDIAYETHDYDRAIESYRKATAASDVIEGVGWHELGFAYLRKGCFDEAEEAFRDVLKAYYLDTTIEVIHAHFGLASVARARGDVEEAQEYAQLALDSLSSLHVEHKLVQQIRRFLREVTA